MSRTRPPRRGFTLVELLVSAALTILMMAVVAVAFQAALKAHSDLHSVSWLADQLRSANAILNRDLDAPHLWDDEAGKKVRVSEAPLYSVPGYVGWSAPHQHGFFHVRQSSLPRQSYKSVTAPGDHGYVAQGSNAAPYPYLDEGAENGKRSYRAGGAPLPPAAGFTPDHVLNMTIRLDADKPENAAATRAPTGMPANSPNNLVANPFNMKDLDPTGTQFVSRWAEVSYFLAPTPLFTSTEGQPPGTPALPLYTLRRRQWVLTPQTNPLVHDPSNAAPAPETGRVLDPATGPVQLPQLFPEVSATPDPAVKGYQRWWTNTPASVTSAANRGGGTGAPFTPNPGGSDVLLSNVVSFQVRVQSEVSALPQYPPGGGPGAETYRPLPVVLPNPNQGLSPNGWHPGFYPQPGTFHDLGLALEDHRYQPPISPPSYPAVFDTAMAPHFHNPPPPGPAPPSHPPVPVMSQHIRQLRAIEIVVRVYDFKTHLTRQITIKKDL